MTIIDNLKQLDTENRTVKEIAYRLDAEHATIRKYLYKLQKPFKRQKADEYEFICEGCEKLKIGGIRSKLCEDPECQAKKTQRYQKPINAKGKRVGKCARCKRVRILVTDHCRPCVAWLESNYGEGYVRFSG